MTSDTTHAGGRTGHGPDGRAPLGRGDAARMFDGLVAHAPFAIAAFDASPAYACVRHNAAFLSLVGAMFRDAGTVEGAPLRDLLDEASFNAIHVAFEQVRTSGEAASADEFDIVRRPRRRPHTYTWSVTPISERGRVRWLLLTAVEVSALVRDREAARASEQRVRREAGELARLARLLTETLDPEEVGRRTVGSVLPLFGAAFSRFRVLQPDGTLRLIAWCGGLPANVGVRALPRNVGIAGRAVVERRSLWTPDVIGDAGVTLNDEARQVAEVSGSGAILAVPLWTRGAIVGALTIGDRTGRRFTPDEVALLEAFGHQAAIALENARLHADALRRGAEAEAAVRVRDEFLSVAAHELKTPLTSLRGFAQLCLRQLDATGRLDLSVARLALGGIDRQSEKLGRLVSRLLEVSRFDAGHLELHREETDLVRLASGVVAAARARAPEHPIALAVPDEVTVRVDPVRVDQIITNLLENAIKYGAEGEPISLELTEPAPDTVQLAVRDRGRGIDPEHRDRIFDRFFQAHARDHASGMGLGLYISRQLARVHGGDLRAEFPEDGGTRFVLTLPRGQRVEGRG